MNFTLFFIETVKNIYVDVDYIVLSKMGRTKKKMKRVLQATTAWIKGSRRFMPSQKKLMKIPNHQLS